MIVVDSSVWIDHLHRPEPHLSELLMREDALMHPHVLGEIALGSINNRARVLSLLDLLPVAHLADDGYVRILIDEHELAATGIGYTDAHLLASALLTRGGRLWTRDKRLRAQAERLSVEYFKS
jgi:predicted nucleic acid-binding protein